MDINLVMNAINQIAALDRKRRRPAHPLLFSLSNYLHTALSALPDQSVRRQVELAGVHAVLCAGVRHCSLSLRVSNCPQATVSIRRGVLQEMALCLVRHTPMNPGERWKLNVGFIDAGDAGRPLGVSMVLGARRPGAAIDRYRLLQALGNSPGVLAGHVVLEAQPPRTRSKHAEAGFCFRVPR